MSESLCELPAVTAVLDVDLLLQRMASIDLTPPGATSRQRRNARRVFHRLTEQLPPGTVEHAAEADLLTVEQYLEAVRWRRAQGLAP